MMEEETGKTVRGIVWVPHEAGEGEYIPAPMFTTFGTGEHAGSPDLVYVEEITGPEFTNGHRNPWGLDPEIAGLIIALNAAGIKTVQSCQEITDLGEDDLYGDLPRMGIVVVEYGTFPLVARVLPEDVSGTNFDGHGDGWLFAASPDAKYVSILFPWRDLQAFTDAVKTATS
jgi:hypothetical protein